MDGRAWIVKNQDDYYQPQLSSKEKNPQLRGLGFSKESGKPDVFPVFFSTLRFASLRFASFPRNRYLCRSFVAFGVLCGISGAAVQVVGPLMGCLVSLL